MIPITPMPEPANFDWEVRQPGNDFLIINPNPSSKDFERAPHWRKALKQLYKAYGKICAYCAHWIPPDTGARTVDHFIPIDADHNLAYDWSNFRLASLKMNNRKWTFRDVLDPFTIGPSWFILDFPSLIIKPNATLSPTLKSQILATIIRLKLNEDEDCIESRSSWIEAYCKGDLSFDRLKKYAPFIAYELERQQIMDNVASIMHFRN